MRGIIPSKILVGLAFLMLFVGYGWAQSGGDLAALNAFKASADPGHVLDSKWNASKTGYCRWDGVKECMNGSVTKLVLEYSQLNGTFAEKTLDRLDQLRVLSLKGNGLKGTIPDLSGLRNLKILFLDYNGFTGSRSTGGKPLHWTSCLKIAEDVANGLAYLHQASKLIHGNLKSSNVLVGRDFEACITDFGLTVFDTEQSEDPSLLGYKAPECKSIKKMGPKADVYSFGVLILELLTGKTPLPSFLNGPATDLPRWVRSVRQEEMDQGAAFDDSFCTNEGSEDKLVVLLNISMSCVSLSPDQRPTMREVLRMIEEIKDAQISSDQSPRWSDTVHSLPRDNSSERSFTERD